MRDPRRHLADRGETLLHARLALVLLRLGDVLEGVEHAAFAARGEERRGTDPQLDVPSVVTGVAEFDPRQSGARRLGRGGGAE